MWQAEQVVQEAERDGLAGLVNRAAQRLPGFTLCIIMEGVDNHLRLREMREFRAAGASMRTHFLCCAVRLWGISFSSEKVCSGWFDDA